MASSLVGQTFLVHGGRSAIAMIVERESLGWCYCKSLDLQQAARWPSDAVRRALREQGKDPGPDA